MRPVFYQKPQLPPHLGSGNQRYQGLQRPQTRERESKFSITAMVCSAGPGTPDGPILWRIEAEGQARSSRQFVEIPESGTGK
ncbi:MAG: hypothetical protein P8P32_17110 [Akkermansiaceae bacterium]|nr:hypothetical protein [Akkermansiaceae bacterium]MDG2324265.1 hypothetical protein [Akkermansiaceae bacterium]